MPEGVFRGAGLFGSDVPWETIRNSDGTWQVILDGATESYSTRSGGTTGTLGLEAIRVDSKGYLEIVPSPFALAMKSALTKVASGTIGRFLHK
ncbi:MAG: hypothetical protein WCO33_02655 [bacterium]